MQEMNFGRYITELRIAKGFNSQRKLAKASGVSNGTIARVEAGTQKPQEDTLRLLAQALGVGYLELAIRAGLLTPDELGDYEPAEEIDMLERFEELQALYATKGYTLDINNEISGPTVAIYIADDVKLYETNIPLATFVKNGRSKLNKLPDLVLAVVLGSELVEKYISDLIETMRHPHEESYIDDFAENFEDYLSGNRDLELLDLKSMIYQQNGKDREPLLGTDEEAAANLLAMLNILEKVEETEIDLQRIEYRAARLLDINQLLANDSAKYNGHRLTEQDRRRILDMLKALFPEYQEPPQLLEQKGE